MLQSLYILLSFVSVGVSMSAYVHGKPELLLDGILYAGLFGFLAYLHTFPVIPQG